MNELKNRVFKTMLAQADLFITFLGSLRWHQLNSAQSSEGIFTPAAC